jgi:hypothetical protein
MLSAEHAHIKAAIHPKKGDRNGADAEKRGEERPAAATA